MDYLLLKAIHVLSSVLLFGTALGSAFYKYFTDRTGVLPAIAETNRLVVIADWLFTAPTVIIQPLSGFLLIYIAGWPWNTPWLMAAYGLFLIAGACWLPVVWLQIRMRDISREALLSNTSLPAQYHWLQRFWFWLGVPAFTGMVGTVLLMVIKPTL